MTLAFKRLAVLVPRNGLLLLGSDSPRAAALAAQAASPVETFGLTGDPTWHATDVAVGGVGTSFKVRRHGTFFGAFTLPLLGQHNVRNALAAIATGHAVGLDAQAIAEGFRTFQGVKRRLELRGSVSRNGRDIRVYDDFAHHPTAVGETIAALRLAHPDRRIWAIFEPRSASSCLKVFQRDFVDAFESADEVVVAPVFRSKVAEDRRLSPDELVADLRARGRSAHALGSTADIVDHVAAHARAWRPDRGHVEWRVRRHSREVARSAAVARVMTDQPEKHPSKALRVRLTGDAALTAEFEPRADVVINRAAAALGRVVRDAALPGVRDVVVTTSAVTAYVEPLVVDWRALETLLSTPVEPTPTPAEREDPLIVPVRYRRRRRARSRGGRQPLRMLAG